MTTKTAQSARPSVLIVDDSIESRAVLRTVLEHRGMSILEANDRVDALRLLQHHHPPVTVIDLETVSENDRPFVEFQQASSQHATSLVVIGQLKGSDPHLPASQILPKPYHYGPLVRTIEHLLDNVQSTK